MEEDDFIDMMGAAQDMAAGLGGATDPEYSQKFLSKLEPEVRARVQILEGLDKKVEDQQEPYKQKCAEIKAKFNELAKNIHSKRQAIILGERNPTDEEVKNGFPEAHSGKVSLEDGGTAGQGSVSGGLEGFWLKALKHHALIAEMITDADCEALNYLRDLEVTYVEGQSGFILSFHFLKNEFFEEETLNKTFFLKQNTDWDESVEKTIGTTITWKEGKNLTVKQVKKKQKNKNGKTREVVKEKKCDSFFDFFCSWGDTGYTEEDQEVDHAVGDLIRSKIVPYAVHFYTGEADNGKKQMKEEELNAQLASMMGGGAGGPMGGMDPMSMMMGGGGGPGGGGCPMQ